jgi:hypothetical protein
MSGCSGSSFPVGSQQQAAGGAGVTGGASGIASGGKSAIGGSPSTGASMPSTGGSSSVSGSSGTGGSLSVAGSSSTVATGGSSSVAGSSSTVATGGRAPTGGAPASGGGGLGSGGNLASGGTASATGGSQAMTGGTTAIGGSSSTAGAGGGTVSGVHSRVALVEPTSNQFVAYDSEGNLVHDYSSLLDFGADFDERTVCIGRTAVAWDTSPTSASFPSVAKAPPNKYPPLAASEIFVRARRPSDGSVSVRIANAGGTVIDEFSVAGDFRVFEPSPSRQFILGSVASFTGVLIRRSNHAIVWQGQLSEGAFSPDDQHLLVAPTSSSNALVIIETATGRSFGANLASLPAAFVSSGTRMLSVKGVLNEGAVVSIYRSDITGEALFWVNWDGTIRPFDASLPTGVNEYLYAANGDDTRLAWWRIANSSSTPVAASLLGWFEFDPVSKTNRSLPNLSNTSKDCYDANVTTYYKLDVADLLSCSCNSGTCASFASLTLPADSAWMPEVSVSPRRGIIGYTFGWPLNRMPLSPATSALFNPEGSVLLQAEGNYFQWYQFDRLDELAVATGKVIVSGTTGHTTTLNGSRSIVMVE